MPVIFGVNPDTNWDKKIPINNLYVNYDDNNKYCIVNIIGYISDRLSFFKNKNNTFRLSDYHKFPNAQLHTINYVTADMTYDKCKLLSDKMKETFESTEFIEEEYINIQLKNIGNNIIENSSSKNMSCKITNCHFSVRDKKSQTSSFKISETFNKNKFLLTINLSHCNSQNFDSYTPVNNFIEILNKNNINLKKMLKTIRFNENHRLVEKNTVVLKD